MSKITVDDQYEVGPHYDRGEPLHTIDAAWLKLAFETAQIFLERVGALSTKIELVRWTWHTQKGWLFRFFVGHHPSDKKIEITVNLGFNGGPLTVNEGTWVGEEKVPDVYVPRIDARTVAEELVPFLIAGLRNGLNQHIRTMSGKMDEVVSIRDLVPAPSDPETAVA